MKYFSVVILVIIFTINMYSKDTDKEYNKIEVLESKTGSMIKYFDNRLPALKNKYGTVNTRIRTFVVSGQHISFYQIIKSTAASISYVDLVEIIEVIEVFEKEVVKDEQSDSDYLQNKYVTDDGFTIGYYVSDGKSKWYLSIPKSGEDDLIPIDDISIIKKEFINAKLKIEELAKK